MKINMLVRQWHRWLSMIFIATVLAASFAAASGQGTDSVLYYLPLPPLFLLMGSGVYLFALPYVAKWRGRASAPGA